jgi:formate hydrogenlyase subunit 3/multisubunit Na+/H+ antiporter MnhD subunit
MTMLLAAAAVLNPIGMDIIYSAFLTGEQLSRNIWQSIALVAIAALATLVLLEWALRKLILRSRASGQTTAKMTALR